MEISIPNSKTPKFAAQSPIVEFRLILKRDGDKLRLDTPAPRCCRSFDRFTTAEKAAYNAILTHVVHTAGDAMRKAVRV